MCGLIIRLCRYCRKSPYPWPNPAPQRWSGRGCASTSPATQHRRWGAPGCWRSSLRRTRRGSTFSSSAPRRFATSSPAAARSTSTACSIRAVCSTKRESMVRRSKASRSMRCSPSSSGWRPGARCSSPMRDATATGPASPRFPRHWPRTTSHRCWNRCAEKSSPMARSPTMPRTSCAASGARWSASIAPLRRACANRCGHLPVKVQHRRI